MKSVGVKLRFPNAAVGLGEAKSVGRPNRAGETIDHVAFCLNDHEEMRRKLDRLSMPYSQMDLPELGERRLRTPSGIQLELVFRDRAAEFVAPTNREQSRAK